MLPGRSTLRYATGWLAAGVVVLGLVLFVAGRPEPKVTLPPVQGTSLASAVRTSGCDLRVAVEGRPTDPPTDGDAEGLAVAPGAYEDPVAPERLVAAMRRGLVVLHFRPDRVADEVPDELEVVREALPRATILAPDLDMPYAVAITAYRRLLGCERYDRRALDAMRFFRGRFVGSNAVGDPAT